MPYIVPEDDENFRWDDATDKWRCLNCGWQSKLATKTMYQAHLAEKSISVHFKVKTCSNAPVEVRNEMTKIYKGLQEAKMTKKRQSELSHSSNDQTVSQRART
jgi:hypothetical protein